MAVRTHPRAQRGRPPRHASAPGRPHRAEVAERLVEPGRAAALLGELRDERRAVPIRLAGSERWIAAEDAGRYRDGLGAMPPAGLPDVFLEPVPDALTGLIARYARGHGPFVARQVADRLGIAVDAATEALSEPGGAWHRWCAARSALVPPAGSGATPRCCAVFAARAWPSPARGRAGRGRDARTVPARVAADRPRAPGPRPRCAAGGDRAAAGARAARRAVGAGGVPATDRRLLADVARCPRRRGRDRLGRRRRDGPRRRPRGACTSATTRRCLGPPPSDPPPEGDLRGPPTRRARRRARRSGTRSPAGIDAPAEEVFTTLWSLVWAGEVTNDLWMPLRAPRRLPTPHLEPFAVRAAQRPGRRGGAWRRRRALVAHRPPLRAGARPRRARPGRQPRCSWSATVS